MAASLFFVTAPMVNDYFYNCDGEMLILPQEGSIRFFTEFGKIEFGPGELCVIPRGVKFKAEPVSGPVRGYLCENYGAKFTLPNRGPIGANCLANPRDFKTPVAAFEDVVKPSLLTIKWCEGFSPQLCRTLRSMSWRGMETTRRISMTCAPSLRLERSSSITPIPQSLPCLLLPQERREPLM
jgi:homogentisate 1,2-dioxygenase